MSDIKTKLFIDGRFVDGEGQNETAFEPALGKPLAEVASASDAQIDAAIQAADRAYRGWSKTTPRERSAALLAIADAIEAKGEVLADMAPGIYTVLPWSNCWSSSRSSAF